MMNYSERHKSLRIHTQRSECLTLCSSFKINDSNGESAIYYDAVYKLKNSILIALISLLIIFGNISCAFRNIINPLPRPAILEEEQLPHKVAILPFVNKTSNPEGSEIVRKMFYNFFSSLNYIDLELAVIDDTLKRVDLYQKIVTGKEVSPQEIGQLLGVDAIIFAEVLSLGKIYALIYTDNQAGLKAQMIRCKRGKVIWELEHTIHLEDGEIPLSPIGLAATVVKTAISHQQATHMKAASELCMQVVTTIPNPPARVEPPPKIDALVHNGAGKLLRPGDYLKVALVGKEGQTASWSLPPLLDNLAMKEKEPGIYIGAYRIKPRDRLPHGRLIGYLRSDSGSASQWVDILGPLKIGKPTILPSVIAEDTSLDGDKSPYLVKDALIVLPGVKLTIHPGTVIWFHSLGLIVKGQIQILGTEKDPVRLASVGSSNWKGLFFDQSSTENKLYFCEILKAEFGVRVSDSTVSIQNCLFQDNVWGIVVDNGTAEINSSLIRTCEKIGIAARKARLVVKKSIITENNSGGFLLDDSKAHIEQNNILNNGGWAIKVIRDHSQVKASNNWWGKANPGQMQIAGPVNIQPVLTKPIDFMVMD
jgi:hypothetical protein